MKFALTDGEGRRISDADGAAIAAACEARLSWTRAPATGGSSDTSAGSNPANTDRCFRYDAAGDQFVYNLGTKDFAPGTYELSAEVRARGALHTNRKVVVGVQ